MPVSPKNTTRGRDPCVSAMPPVKIQFLYRSFLFYLYLVHDFVSNWLDLQANQHRSVNSAPCGPKERQYKSGRWESGSFIDVARVAVPWPRRHRQGGSEAVGQRTETASATTG